MWECSSNHHNYSRNLKYLTPFNNSSEFTVSIDYLICIISKMHFCRVCLIAVIAIRHAGPALSKAGAKLDSQPQIPTCLLPLHQLLGQSQQYATAPAASAAASSFSPLWHRTQGNHKVMLHMTLAEYAGSNHMLSGGKRVGGSFLSAAPPGFVYPEETS